MKSILIAAFALCACSHPAPTPPEAHNESHNSLIHEPPGGCPPSSKLEKDRFTEKDGRKESACEMPNGDGTLDVLKPGESFSVHIPIASPPPPAANKL